MTNRRTDIHTHRRSHVLKVGGTRGTVSYPDTLGLGEIASIGEDVGGLGAVPPAGSRGRAPGQGVWGLSFPEAGSLLLHN